MDFLVVVFSVVVVFQLLKKREQRRRIQLLGSHLSQHQIEPLMASLLQGYDRALSVDDPQLRDQVWHEMLGLEQELSRKFARFAADFARVWGDHALVSTLTYALPYADKLFPRATFDLRHALAIHADGIAAAVDNAGGQSPRDKAYTLTAELLLMQHTCHWYCRSRFVATGRMLARHQTPHEQLVSSVSPATRQAYCRLVGC